MGWDQKLMPLPFPKSEQCRPGLRHAEPDFRTKAADMVGKGQKFTSQINPRSPHNPAPRVVHFPHKGGLIPSTTISVVDISALTALA